MDNYRPLEERPPADLRDRLHMAALNALKARPTKCRLKAPLVSFSFDDAPKSAITAGAAMLENAGARGTFYLTGSHCGQSFEGVEQYSAEDVKLLHKNGHEIACHSFGHGRFRGRDDSQLSQDLSHNQAFFHDLVGANNLSLDSFAYPYGEFDYQSRELIAERFLCGRGVYRGVNYGTMDFANLRTTPLEKRRFSTKYLQTHLAKAIKHNGWIIFFTHDIADDCTDYGSTPEILQETIDAVNAHGIEIVTVREGAKRVLARA